MCNIDLLFFIVKSEHFWCTLKIINIRHRWKHLQISRNTFICAFKILLLWKQDAHVSVILFFLFLPFVFLPPSMLEANDSPAYPTIKTLHHGNSPDPGGFQRLSSHPLLHCLRNWCIKIAKSEKRNQEYSNKWLRIKISIKINP